MSARRQVSGASDHDTPWMHVGIDEVIIQVSVLPGASRRGLIRVGPEGLVIAVNAAPDKGKANDELIEYLSDTLLVPRSAVMISRGETARKKTIRIVTHEATKLAARLRRISKPS